MTVNQVSVFIENRQGRLGEVLEVLKNNSVNILSMSLADTSEYGLLRLIVNDPKATRDMLIDSGFSSMLTEVLVIKIPHVSGALQKILSVIAKENISIEYMYGLSVASAGASVVLKTNQLARAIELLKREKIDTMTEEELFSA